LLPSLRALFKTLTRVEISRMCEAAKIGFAPIRRPDELLDDPHLACPGAMVEVALPKGGSTPIPALPIEMNGQRLKKRLDIPRVGEHSADIASELGCERGLIEELIAEGVLGVEGPDADPAATGAKDEISEIASA
jgi:crotonobetainyl-CoA:carnitine CoA-transferase CaiB-like acyl-CoA transferase